ncbi:MAG: aminotransferase class IV [Alistipes sp.]|jgi:hypothetical protein|nr:aminotransferase class IV [Alistipes sp.]
MNPSSHFVYQRVHTLGGKALHLGTHLEIAARAFEHIYGVRPAFDERSVARRITGFLHTLRTPSRTSCTVMIYLDGSGRSEIFSPSHPAELEIVYERQLLDAGYALSPLRPKAVSYEYSIPFGAYPTGFQLSSRTLFDTLAFRHHGATRSVRRRGDSLVSCGDATIFALRGKTLLTPSTGEGAMETVERGLVMEAAPRARLTVVEEPIRHSELKSFDELFFADAAGITSLSECDGAKFMSLVAPRLAAALSR